MHGYLFASFGKKDAYFLFSFSLSVAWMHPLLCYPDYIASQTIELVLKTYVKNKNQFFFVWAGFDKEFSICLPA
jgi:hypothetical protein